MQSISKKKYKKSIPKIQSNKKNLKVNQLKEKDTLNKPIIISLVNNYIYTDIKNNQVD